MNEHIVSSSLVHTPRPDSGRISNRVNGICASDTPCVSINTKKLPSILLCKTKSHRDRCKGYESSVYTDNRRHNRLRPCLVKVVTPLRVTCHDMPSPIIGVRCPLFGRRVSLLLHWVRASRGFRFRSRDKVQEGRGFGSTWCYRR